MKAKNSVSIFQRPLWVFVFALMAAIAWGLAYPLIKLGYGEFGITPAMTGSKMLFAGIRFTIAGLIVLAMALSARKDFHVRNRADFQIARAHELPFSIRSACSPSLFWHASSLRVTV